MSYNLNFYPNDYNQQNIGNNFSNPYNPYSTLLGLDNGMGYRNIQQFTENIVNPFNNTQQNVQSCKKPYYLYCGDKKDWDEFLQLNYGITEQIIFDDYKLFLQAKQELMEEQGQNKINNMKDRIRGNNFINVDSTIQSNVKPEYKQPDVKPKSNIVRDDNSISNGYNSESDNGLPTNKKSKN